MGVALLCFFLPGAPLVPTQAAPTREEFLKLELLLAVSFFVGKDGGFVVLLDGLIDIPTKTEFLKRDLISRRESA